MTIKKILFGIAGIVFLFFAKLVWYWKDAGLVKKSTAIILSLVLLIFGLASFYVAAPESITRAADVDISVTIDSENGMCYDDGGCFIGGVALRMGYRPGAGYLDIFTGFRFPNIAIPQGATIDSAYLTYVAYNNDASTDDVKVWAEATDDAAVFNTTTRTPKSVTAGSNSVAWTLPNQTANSSYTSPDIKTVVQEVVNRAGWSSGNGLAILVRNNGATENHIFIAADYGIGASIAINYTAGGGAERRIIKIE